MNTENQNEYEGYWKSLPKKEQKYIDARPWKCIYVVRYDSLFYRSYCLFCKNLVMLKIGYEILGVPVGVAKWVKLFCASPECPIDVGRDAKYKNKTKPHFIIRKNTATINKVNEI